MMQNRFSMAEWARFLWPQTNRSTGKIIEQLRAPNGQIPNDFLKSSFVRKFREHFDLEFDAQFFRQRYEHVLPPELTAPSGSDDALFRYYLTHVREAFLDPNSMFLEADYLALNEDVCVAVDAGHFLCGFHHWVLHGRREKRSFRRPPQQLPKSTSGRQAVEDLFDRHYYVKIAEEATHSQIREEDALDHFLLIGQSLGLVPAPPTIFDEEFYTAYYQDVKQAKTQGKIPSGYYHYVRAGRAEGRIPTHDLGRLLEAKLGELGNPEGLQRLNGLRHRLKPVPMQISSRFRPVMNVFIPSLDPDLMFGGYIAFLNFLCRLVENGHEIRFLIMEDGQSNRSWFLKGIASRPRWVKAFSGQQVVNISSKDRNIEFNEDDICIAYSCWIMHEAWSVARHLRNRIVIFFIQEYEPIFNEFNSLHFIANSAYLLPHVAIFNSEFLLRYFEAEKIGVFSQNGTGKFLHFNHVIGNVSPDPAKLSRTGARRRLICYARPERHAGRNLFEICVMALSLAVSEGVFEGDWEFVGIGSLHAGNTVELGAGVEMTIIPRVEQHKYEALLQSFDVGLSLMWAPHPGVMHFEMAKAGIVTVTNVFGNRTSEALSQFGHNIVPCEASIDGIVEGLRTAVLRSNDLTSRIEGSQIGAPSDWDTVFDKAFFQKLKDLLSG